MSFTYLNDGHLGLFIPPLVAVFFRPFRRAETSHVSLPLCSSCACQCSDLLSKSERLLYTFGSNQTRFHELRCQNMLAVEASAEVNQCVGDMM
jgi:hypothetical protein